MWWCEASITRTSSRSQRTTISPSISSTGCVLSMMMRVTPVALTASITLTAWCQTTFICSFVSVMRKLVIPSRELQVHMSIVTQIKDYKYSSWCEYDGTVEPVFQICNTQTVLNRIPFNDFRIAGVSNSSEFQKLDRGTQWQVFIQLKELGASVRQLQCLTGIDRGIIQKARWTKHLPQGACIPPPVSYLSPDIFGYCTAFSNFRWLHPEFQTPFIHGLNLHLVTILLYFAALMVSE